MSDFPPFDTRCKALFASAETELERIEILVLDYQCQRYALNYKQLSYKKNIVQRWFRYYRDSGIAHNLTHEKLDARAILNFLKKDVASYRVSTVVRWCFRSFLHIAAQFIKLFSFVFVLHNLISLAATYLIMTSNLTPDSFQFLSVVDRSRFNEIGVHLPKAIVESVQFGFAPILYYNYSLIVSAAVIAIFGPFSIKKIATASIVPAISFGVFVGVGVFTWLNLWYLFAALISLVGFIIATIRSADYLRARMAATRLARIYYIPQLTPIVRGAIREDAEAAHALKTGELQEAARTAAEKQAADRFRAQFGVRNSPLGKESWTQPDLSDFERMKFYMRGNAPIRIYQRFNFPNLTGVSDDQWPYLYRRDVVSYPDGLTNETQTWEYIASASKYIGQLYPIDDETYSEGIARYRSRF